MRSPSPAAGFFLLSSGRSGRAARSGFATLILSARGLWSLPWLSRPRSAPEFTLAFRHLVSVCIHSFLFLLSYEA